VNDRREIRAICRTKTVLSNLAIVQKNNDKELEEKKKKRRRRRRRRRKMMEIPAKERHRGSQIVYGPWSVQLITTPSHS